MQNKVIIVHKQKNYDMKKYSIWTLIVAVLTSMAFTACDTSTSSSEAEVSRDCIITSATLGNLKREVKAKTSAGVDTTYIYTVTGGAYSLYIDQVNYRIYNPEYLPQGTRTDKLVFAEKGMVNTGTLSIKSLSTGNDTIFTPTDSTDFSVPREVTVHANDGVSKRTYTVDIRVYKENPDSLAWTQVANNPLSDIASFVESKALSVGGALYVFGQRADGTTQVVQTETADAHFDSAINIAGLTHFNVRSVQYFKGQFYALANGQLITSATGLNDWTSVSTSQRFDALAAVVADSIYGVADGKMYASADGQTWRLSQIDTEGHLPTQNLAFTTLQSRTDKNGYMAIMVGSDADGMAVLKRDFDAMGSFSYPWMYIPQTEELGEYACPKLSNVNLFTYDGSTILAGTTTDGTMAPFYTSQDNGRTWKANELPHPTLTGVKALAVTVDSEQFIWVICSGTGIVYKGRINRLAMGE